MENGLKPNVLVLMSSYNGSRYIKEQIDSILQQEGVNVKLLVRDDGSFDNTLEILEEYIKNDKLSYYTGDNIGPALSYIDLIYNAPDYEYIAFSDQDDYWEKNKLHRAVEQLKNYSKPAMYDSIAKVVNSRLEHEEKIYGNIKYYNLLTQMARSNVIGCTLVINYLLFKVLKIYRPREILMHDQWISIVCKAYNGIVVKDSQSYILYRQHEENVLGAEYSLSKRIAKSSLVSNTNSRYKQALELYKGYSKILNGKNYKQLYSVVNYKKSFIDRIRCIFRKYNTGSFVINFLIRLAFAGGKF